MPAVPSTNIKGADGQRGLDGRDGINGRDGYTPIKGIDYFDGINGKDGKTPIKGIDYFDGSDGYTPIKGVDYFDGINGIDGKTPIKGVDYFTETEIDQISSEAAEKLKVPQDLTDRLAELEKENKNQERDIRLLKLAAEGHLYTIEEDTEEAYSKDIAINTLPYATIDSIGGKTVVRNQLFHFADRITNTYRVVDNRLIIEDYVPSFVGQFDTLEAVTVPINHKYLFICNDNRLTNVRLRLPAQSLYIDGDTVFESVSDRIEVALRAREADKVINYDTKLSLIDLTQWFGAEVANTITTPEQAYALGLPRDYIPYDEGTLISADVESVVSKGRNLFKLENENWEPKPYNEYKLHLPPGNYSVALEYNLCNKSNNPLIGDYVVVINVSSLNLNWFVDTKVYLGHTGTPTKPTTFRFSVNDGESVSLYVYAAGKTTGLDFVSILSTLFGHIQINAGDTPLPYAPYFLTQYPIPEAIKNLPGYGWSAGSVYNEVDIENKQYIQRVGSYTLNGTEVWVKTAVTGDDYQGFAIASNSINAYDGRGVIVNTRFLHSAVETVPNTCNQNTGTYGIRFTIGKDIAPNGETKEFKDWLVTHPLEIHYRIAEPIVTDISDIFPNDFTEIEVEAGGTITFKQSELELPVPNKETYMIKLGGCANE